MDSLNNILSFVSIDSSQTLQAAAHFTNNIIFSTQGITSVLPGNYHISIFYRPKGGTWVKVDNNGSFINKASLKIVNTDSIALYSSIQNLSGNLIAGNTADFNLNVINNSNSNFKGEYKLSLYTLNGALVQTINTFTDNIGLSKGSNFNTPPTFNTSGLNIAAGSYLLGLTYRSADTTTSSSWNWVGTGVYQNPVLVNVTLQPDQYESNDSINKSYVFSPVFINDSASLYTKGANIHIANDHDFYKLKLPTGYNYSVKTILNSANYSSNGSTYTLDGLFSISNDSISWSGNFKDTTINSDTILGGTTLYFHVIPANSTGSGTYLLNIYMNRISPVLSGSVKTAKGVNIPDYSISLKSNIGKTVINGSGDYNIKLLGTKDSISVLKQNDVKKANGVTTLDIALIQSHILQKSILNSPYKLIAADVNGDNTISALDVVNIKRLVLGIDTTFIKTSNSAKRLWVFVVNDQGYNLADSVNAFPFNSTRYYSNANRNITGLNFVGCKLGDVNWDWNPAIPRPIINNNFIELSYLSAPTNAADGYIHIPIKVKNFKEMLGLQFTINFNPALMQWKGITNNPLGIETGTNHAEEGSVTFLWVDAKNEIKTLEDGSSLFELVFKSNYQLSTINYQLLLDGSVTAIAAYDKDYAMHNVVLNRVENILPLQKETWTVSPNPATGGIINIQLNLNDKKTVVFKLSDNTGKTVMVKQVEGVKGNNNINLKEGNIASGTYYLQAVGVDGVKQLIINHY